MSPVRKRPYARGTVTSIESSIDEIKHLVERFGGDKWFYAVFDGEHRCGFRKNDRFFRFQLKVPKDPAEHRRKWRCMVIHIKATFVAIEEEILSLDAGLMPWLMLPDGRTMAEVIPEQVDRMLATGQGPDLDGLMLGPAR